MAKGVPILGKDPLGKAKYANVTESGDLRVQLSGTDVEFVSHDATSTDPGAVGGSSSRQIAGQNVRAVTSASSGAGFIPIDCRGMVSLSVFLENPSSSTRTFFNNFGIYFFDTLTPGRTNLYAARVSVDFGEVPPGSQLFVDLTPYLAGYLGLGLRFHTYDSSEEPGEFTFKFRGIRRPVREV